MQAIEKWLRQSFDEKSRVGIVLAMNLTQGIVTLNNGVRTLAVAEVFLKACHAVVSEQSEERRRKKGGFHA